MTTISQISQASRAQKSQSTPSAGVRIDKKVDSAPKQAGATKAVVTSTPNLPAGLELMRSQGDTTKTASDIINLLHEAMKLIGSLLDIIRKGQREDRASKPAPKPTPQPRQIGQSLIPATGNFLWKPQSDKDGKLAILLPTEFVGKVASVSVVGPNGETTASGKYAGVGNGEREHYRFSKSGGDFADGSSVLIKMKDGSTKSILIKDTSARFQR